LSSLTRDFELAFDDDDDDDDVPDEADLVELLLDELDDFFFVFVPSKYRGILNLC